ncbi:hypothetical protein BP5796_02947 [Coleophoma crateriformis]|uniref:Heterokaryon incompatibility domain-containing protein n=1 Tax=Coleophoma crateriformis TaxID=565419 RepID=A0A3D8SLR1_9HELO|nr:hypothetical protein BP5796_02947 [Coleophoma crateriformis]
MNNQMPENDSGSEPPLVNLCSYCRPLVDDLEGYLKIFDTGETYIRLRDPPKDFISSSREGCNLCQAFVLGLLYNRSNHSQQLLNKLYKNGSSSEFGYYNCLRKQQMDGFEDTFYAQREMYDGDQSVYSEVWFFRRKSTSVVALEVSTASQSSLSFATELLERCRSSHPKCQSPDALITPTRLIELYEGGCRLRTDVVVGTPYTTLSHCWGSIDILKLRKDNINELHDFPLSKLSKTFQDAVFLSRSLGFKYIWIDSVCIIQDNVDDWRRESAKMSQVYGNSSLNIAATYAKDGSIGLFVDRDPSSMKNQCIITPEKKIFEFAASGGYERCIADAPLSSRAWTFQERYLARRTLHFSGEQIFWECREITACEALPDGIPNSMIRYQDQFPSTANPAEWCQVVPNGVLLFKGGEVDSSHR